MLFYLLFFSLAFWLATVLLRVNPACGTSAAYYGLVHTNESFDHGDEAKVVTGPLLLTVLYKTETNGSLATRENPCRMETWIPC